MDKEEQVDSHMREVFGAKWERVPSANINKKYREEAGKIFSYLQQAIESNSKLEKSLKDDKEKFANLQRSREDLAGDLPAMDENNKTNPAADKLKELLDKLSGIIAKREELKEEYRKKVDEIDLTGALVSGSGDYETVTAQIKQPLDEIETQLKKGFDEQQEVINQITAANDDFTGGIYYPFVFWLFFFLFLLFAFLFGCWFACDV